MTSLVYIRADSAKDMDRANELAAHYQLPIMDDRAQENAGVQWQLIVKANELILSRTDVKTEKLLRLDFNEGKIGYRLTHSGRQQAIAKACGLHKKTHIRILDANAGLGRDGVILATLSANVTLLERVPAIAALLLDAVNRLKQQLPMLQLHVVHCDALRYLSETDLEYDVIYLDPMFPSRQKSALVKQELRWLRELAGDDNDADNLLSLALTKAIKRVVVKRPKLAPHLNQQKPDLILTGKSTRFDVYLVS